jgi:hypothetical protein
MPKHVCLLPPALMVLNSAAVTNPCYPKECCQDKDCRLVPCTELHYDGDNLRCGRA